MLNERINKQMKRYRPNTEKCLSLCIASFMLAFLAFLIAPELKTSIETIGAVIIGGGILLINITFAVLSICKWNAFVYVDEDKIGQKSFGRRKDIAYSEIEDIKAYFAFSRLPKIMITICKKGNNISFVWATKLANAFIDSCTNQNALRKLHKQLTDMNMKASDPSYNRLETKLHSLSADPCSEWQAESCRTKSKLRVFVRENKWQFIIPSAILSTALLVASLILSNLGGYLVLLTYPLALIVFWNEVKSGPSPRHGVPFGLPLSLFLLPIATFVFCLVF